MENEINNIITRYRIHVVMFYRRLKERNIPRKVSALIPICFKHILASGVEARLLTPRTRNTIQSVEMKVWRLIRGLTRINRMSLRTSNQNYQWNPHQTSYTKHDVCGVAMYSPVSRMDEVRYSGKFLVQHSRGRRPKGRPRMRRMQIIGD